MFIQITNMRKINEYIIEKLVIDANVQSNRKNTVTEGEKCYMLELDCRDNKYMLSFSDSLFDIITLSSDKVEYEILKTNGKKSTLSFDKGGEGGLDYAGVNKNGYFEFTLKFKDGKESALFIHKNDYFKIIEKFYPKLDQNEEYNIFSNIPEHERKYELLDEYFDLEKLNIKATEIEPEETYKKLAEIFVNVC